MIREGSQRLYARVMIPEVEPGLAIEAELTDVLAELVKCDRSLIDRNWTPVWLISRNMTVADFWGIGASGPRYGRAYVLDELEKRHAVPHADVWEATDFHCRRSAGDVSLLTYTLSSRAGRLNPYINRLQRTVDGWKIIFNRGTIVQGF